jgi:tetratricopeptide (TPR) repeat protein
MTQQQLILEVEKKPARLTQIGPGLLLFAATILAYWPSLHGALIMDDPDHVTAPAMQSWSGLWKIWTVVGATHQYFPFLHSAFWIEHRLWGDSLLGYHLTNVLLHAASACLVVAIMRRMNLAGAWLAGFIFALHPVCVESVAWISEQKNTLSTFLALWSVLIYLHFDNSRRGTTYATAFLLFVLSVLSKNVTVTLPAVLLVIFWWQRGRLKLKRDIAPLLAWFVVGVALTIPSMGLERKMCAAYPAEFSSNFLERTLIAGRVFWFYLAKLLWPENLVYMYPRWTIDAHAAWQYLYPAAAIALFAGLLLFARRNRGPLAAFLIFAGTLFPALGFLNVFWLAISYVGDHLQYLSSLAIIVLFASSAAAMVLKMPPAARNIAFVPALGLLMTLGALTWRQSALYGDPETLYRATLAKNPASWVAHYNLGDTLNQTPGHEDQVIQEWETTVQLRPEYAEAQNNLACILSSDPDRVPEAIEHFRAAIRSKPDFADAHANLAAVLSRDPTQTSAAIDEFNEAIKYDPDSAEAHNNFGNLLMDVPGRLNDAIDQLETAVRLKPDYAEAHWNLAIALSRVPGRAAEAMTHAQIALRLNPDFQNQGAQQLMDHLRDLQQQTPAQRSN